jgi:hypothetical protein
LTIFDLKYQIKNKNKKGKNMKKDISKKIIAVVVFLAGLALCAILVRSVWTDKSRDLALSMLKVLALLASFAMMAGSIDLWQKDQSVIRDFFSSMAKKIAKKLLAIVIFLAGVALCGVVLAAVVCMFTEPISGVGGAVAGWAGMFIFPLMATLGYGLICAAIGMWQAA